MNNARLVFRSYIIENSENAEFLFTHEGYDYYLVDDKMVKTVEDPRPILGVKY